MLRLCLFCGLLAALVVLSGCAADLPPQHPHTLPTRGAGALNLRGLDAVSRLGLVEADLLRTAYTQAAKEIRVAELAAQRLRGQSAGTLASAIAQHQINTSKLIVDTAGQFGLKLVPPDRSEVDYFVNRLSLFEGSDFLVAWTREMIRDREQLLDLYLKAGSKSRNSAIKALIGKTVPELERQLTQLRNIRQLSLGS